MAKKNRWSQRNREKQLGLVPVNDKKAMKKRGDSIGSLRKHAVEMAHPKDDKRSAAYKTS